MRLDVAIGLFAESLKKWLALLSPIRWQGYGVLDRPAMFKSQSDQVSIRPKVARPLSNSFSDSIECQPSIVTPIIGILFRCDPAAIIRRIWAIVVNAIKLGTWWFGSHVGVEIDKGLCPSFADCDASRTVSSITGTRHARTSIAHRVPGVEFPRIGHSVKSAFAAAVGCSSVRQVIGPYQALCAAFASAQPFPAFPDSDIVKDSPISETLAGNIVRLHFLGYAHG